MGELVEGGGLKRWKLNIFKMEGLERIFEGR